MSWQHEITQSGVGSSPVFKPATNVSPFQITLQTLVTGSATYTVQYTKDNVDAPGYSPAAGHWVAIPAMSAATTSIEASLISPVTGIQVVQSAGAGSVVLQIVQAGERGFGPQAVT